MSVETDLAGYFMKGILLQRKFRIVFYELDFLKMYFFSDVMHKMIKGLKGK